MTSTLRGLLLVGAVAAASGTVIAAVHAQTMEPGRHNRLFSAMDTNKDGAVTKDEYKAYRDQMFARHDRNRDGFISQDEMAGPGMGGRSQGMMGSGQSGSAGSTRMGGGMTDVDTDKDGRVSKSEWDARTEQLFALRDRNKDGKLSPDEMGRLGRTGMQR